MAQQCGFFNAELNGDTYDRVYLADMFAAYFASFIGNGIFGSSMQQLEVMSQDTPNMSVKVGSGQGYINGYWYRNTDEYTLSLSVADGTLSRKDLIVLRWDNSARDMYLAVIEGTPSSNPVEPVYRRDYDYYDLVLACVNVAAGAISITQSVIYDRRMDATYCGLVTGVVEQIDLTDLYNQFVDYFERFQNEYEGRYAQWVIEEEDAYANWVNAQKALYTNWINGQESDFRLWAQAFQSTAALWYGDRQQDFEDWFAHLQDIMDTSVAGHLQNEIEELQTETANSEELLDSIAEMLISNRIHAPLRLSTGDLLELSDGTLLDLQWSYKVSDTLGDN